MYTDLETDFVNPIELCERLNIVKKQTQKLNYLFLYTIYHY